MEIRDKQVAIRFDNVLLKAIDKVANNEGRTRSNWIRRQVILALKEKVLND